MNTATRLMILAATATLAGAPLVASAQDRGERGPGGGGEHHGGGGGGAPRAPAPAPRPSAPPAAQSRGSGPSMAPRPRGQDFEAHRFDGRSGRREFLQGVPGLPPLQPGSQQRFSAPAAAYGHGSAYDGDRFNGNERFDQGRRNFGDRRGGNDGDPEHRGEGRTFGDHRGGYDGKGYREGVDIYRGRDDGRRYGGFHYDREDRRAFFYSGRTFYRFHADVYRWPDERWRGYRWYRGAYLPQFFLIQDYYISQYNDFGLAPPPYGYQWIRVGYDALLIDVYTGQVYDVVPGVFF